MLTEILSIPMVIPMEGQLIDWAPSAELINLGKKIAGFALIAWVLYLLWSFLFPGKGSRNGLARMGAGKLIGTVLAILVFADLNLVPKLANTIYAWITGADPLGLLGIK